MTINTCRKLIGAILQQQRTISSYYILMGILPLILEAKDYELVEYGQFFIDYSEDEDLNTFCYK